MKQNRISKSGAYTIILLSGVIFLLLAWMMKDGYFYDLFVNVGASLFVSTIIYTILIAYTFPHADAPPKPEDVKAEKTSSEKDSKYKDYFQNMDELPPASKIIRDPRDFGKPKSK